MQPDPPNNLCRPLRQWKTGLPARTILIDPNQLFEDFYGARDLAPSQVVRQLIRQYNVVSTGGGALPDWPTSNVVGPD